MIQSLLIHRGKLLLFGLFALLVLSYFASLNTIILHSEDSGTLGLHVTYAERMMNGERLKGSLESLPHLGYFYAVIALHRLGFSFIDAGLIVLTIGHLLAFIVTYAIYDFFTPKGRSNLLILSAAFLSLLLVALYLPFFNPNIYFGQGAPNTHHNSTIILLKPLATLAFFLIVHEFQQPQKRFLLLFCSSLILLLSVWVKPTFVLVFLPAMGLYLLFRRERVKNILYLIALSLPALLALASEYLNYYEFADHERSLGFGFFTVWQSLSPNIPLSILQAIAFPLLLTIFRGKQLRYPVYMLLAWLSLFIGFIQFGFILETNNGAVLTTGNWIGGYLIGLSVLYTVAILEAIAWFRELPELSPRQRVFFYISVFILLMHLLSGIIYDYSLLLYSAPIPFG